MQISRLAVSTSGRKAAVRRPAGTETKLFDMAVKKNKTARKNQKAKAKAKQARKVLETALANSAESLEIVENQDETEAGTITETEDTSVSTQPVEAPHDLAEPDTESAVNASTRRDSGSQSSGNDDDEDDEEAGMSFWDHLEVLRWALFRTACVLLVAFCLWFWAMPHIFDSFVMGATSSDFFVYRWLTQLSHGLISFDPDFSVEIINIEVTGPFMIHIKTSFYMAAIVTFPYIIYEVWKFIRPALFENEIRHLRPAFLGGTLMFFIGCAVGYMLVFPFTFRFLTEYNLSPTITNQINLSNYIGNFSMLIIVMGMVFEMPLLAWLLSCFGLITKSFLREYKRHAVVVLLATAAIITPSGDPFTLMIVFIPLYILYEASIWVVQKE